MACNSHNGTTPNGVSCTGYVAPGSGYSFTTADLNQQVIEEYNFNEIRSALANELTRRGLSWSSVGGDPGIKVEGGTIDAYSWRLLRNEIYSVHAFTETYTTNSYLIAGQEPIDQSVEELRTAVNAANAVCVCQCNYGCTCNCNYPCTCNCNYSCTCNCNYPCTCNCNYCTCNCNYCTCNCNYSCTCNCNYSDIRLKKDIEEI